MNYFCEESLESRPSIEYLGDNVIKREYIVHDISNVCECFIIRVV